MSLEAAVDLTKKSAEDWRPRSPPDQLEIDDDRDSDSDTPLDMSVTATSRLTPVFPGFNRDLSPARSDRSTEHLQVRLTSKRKRNLRGTGVLAEVDTPKIVEALGSYSY